MMEARFFDERHGGRTTIRCRIICQQCGRDWFTRWVLVGKEDVPNICSDCEAA
jgi:hypothetical protein